MELATLIATTIGTAAAGSTADFMLGVQDSTLKKFPTFTLGQVPRLYVTASRALALTDTRGGILSSTNAGSTIFTLPTMASMGFTRNASNPTELVFLVQRTGLGALFVTPTVGVAITWNDLDPQYLDRYHAPVMLTSYGTDLYAAS